MLLSSVLLALVYAQTLVITDVTILDSRNATRVPHRDVYVKDGRISSISATSPRKPDARTRQIPGKGKFLLPGLWDMHVHVGEIENDWFDLYLTNGITGLREMAAGLNNVPKQKQYVADVEAGKRTGPRLFWTTESIDQFDGKYKSPVKISNPAEARAAVQYVKSLGSNYVKVYNGLSRVNYLAILDEAKKLGMPVTGHIPDVISVREASRLGQQCMEHLDGFLLACSTKEAEARYMVRLNRYPWKMLLDTFDANKATAIFAELSRNHTWVTPTLMIHRLEAFAKGSLEDSDPRIAYVRRDYLGEWRGVRNNVPDQPLQRRLLDKHVQMTGMLYRAGVPLLAGTDAPNPGSIPGFALHDELELFVQAGLPPSAAINAATWNPAEYFGITKEYGSVEQGKIADILLLNKDPFLDIRYTKDIQAVFVRGKALLRNDLDSMLANVRQAVKMPAVPSH